MSSAILYLGGGFAVFIIGLHGLLVLQDSLRRVMAVNLMGTGVFLVLVALATRSLPADPVLQALVVTGLVVAISATAFALRLFTAQARFRSSQRLAAEEREAGHPSADRGSDQDEAQ